MSKPQQVRALIAQAPEATGPKHARKLVRAIFRLGYGDDWWQNGTTKNVYKRVLAGVMPSVTA